MLDESKSASAITMDHAGDGAPGGEEGRSGLVAAGGVAAGGVAGAIAATSCCILPLMLSVMGLGGAWIANLRALAPYQPIFIIVAVGFIGAGFYMSYRRPKLACADGTACARPLPSKIVRSSLWLAALIVFAAVTFGYWFPYLVPYLP